MSKDHITMGCRESAASSLSEFIQATHKTHLPFYRGQAQDWELMPPLGRLYEESGYGDDFGEGVDELEEELLVAYNRQSRMYIKEQVNNRLDNLIAAESHGLPTRLLSWSQNPLKALFFAVEDIGNENDGVIYGMEPYLDMRIRNPEEVNLDDTYLVTFSPPLLDRLIEAHETCFMLFPLQHWEKDGDEDPLNFHPISKNSPYREIHVLHKITIEGGAKKQILRELMAMGISHKTMFPGIQGISKSLIIEQTVGYSCGDFFSSLRAGGEGYE